MWTILIVVGAAIALPVASFAALGALSQRAPQLGLRDGKLLPCPMSPNCVCSQCDDAGHGAAPWPLTLSAEEAMRRLQAVLTEQGASSVVVDGNYAHATFTSQVFRFVDDVEFLIDTEGGQIHFRSASRVGRSDFGVNRRRMDALRHAYETGP